ILSNYKTQRIPSPELAPYPYAQAEAQKFLDYFTGDLLGLPVIVWIFLIVAVIAWLVYNRTTFGRRVTAIGGTIEAARLAGLRIKPNLVYVYALCGLCAGIGALVILSRTTAGTATHGELYEMDAIAAVVVGGTLLVGGRGTIVGTVIGTLLFVTLTDIFILNNLAVSTQKVAKGLIIVGAVLLQQYLARRERTT
ncbi:MAG: ABC transporter permease, partial [Propionibacteriaceae bacterium]|nr:ABC transporter permease [Propionibacteriaceae bacterium]